MSRVNFHRALCGRLTDRCGPPAVHRGDRPPSKTPRHHSYASRRCRQKRLGATNGFVRDYIQRTRRSKETRNEKVNASASSAGLCVNPYRISQLSLECFQHTSLAQFWNSSALNGVCHNGILYFIQSLYGGDCSSERQLG